MRLPAKDAKLFFGLHHSLMFFVDWRLGVIEDPPASPAEYSLLPPDIRFEVHEAFLENPELVDAFVEENPFHLDEPELEIVGSWKHFIAGRFCVLRYLKNHAVFLSATDPPVAYGVADLLMPFEMLIGPRLPQVVETVLLPFQGRIVYDGMMQVANIRFGGSAKRGLNEDYKEAKAREGIITSLPPGAGPAAPAKPTRSSTKTKKGAAVCPERDRIVALTDEFCRKHFDEEFAALCREMADVLDRERPSPLSRGKPESWACGIVQAIGFVNFTSDPSQPHHMRAGDINKEFGVSASTGASRSRAIRDRLDIVRLSPEWTLPSMMDKNPMIWLAELDGIIIDIRTLPVEIQEQFYQRGWIPYVPGNKTGD